MAKIALRSKSKRWTDPQTDQDKKINAQLVATATRLHSIIEGSLEAEL